MDFVVAEFDPRWDCPKCGELTQMCDEAQDWVDDGDSLTVICHHVDLDDEDGERECLHKYRVDLRG